MPRDTESQKDTVPGCPLTADLDQDLAVLEEESPIYTNFPAFAQVADHVPVDGRLVLAPGLGISLSKGQVNGPAYLLIEQGVLGEALDPVVGAEGKLSHIACPFVSLQHLQQELFILGRRGLRDFPILELQPDVLYLATM